MKRLIIAEKPSVAKTIAKVVGADEARDGYMEGEDFVVSWCYGHLLENAPPDAYGEQFKKWRMDTLPIVPEEWKDIPIESSRNQLEVLMSLMKRRDIASFIEATDAGREGELIFRRVYEYIGTGKPFERLWISSLEAGAIRQGMRELKPSSDYDDLYAAALARSRADWLFGINGTRFYTLAGCMGSEKATVGRVQTPTLAMIVKRQKEIEEFKIEKRYAIQALFDGWKLEGAKFTSEAEARECLQKVKDGPFEITRIERSKKKTSAPRLFSLTSLQRDLNKRFGFSADHTLKIIQGLYERKILSYPRTDSEYITSDMESGYAEIVKNLKERMMPGFDIPSRAKTVVNDAKVSDHYAIIITPSYSRFYGDSRTALSSDESTVVSVIAQRMVEAAAPPYIYNETKVLASCDGYDFAGVGTSPLELGWKGIGKHLSKGRPSNASASDPNEFPSDIEEGKAYKPRECSIVNRDTKPPAFYTEDTLLGAMEKAGAKEMDDDVERKGLGTSATRAEIIEKLIKRGYIARDKKNLKATAEGIHLIASVDDGFKNVATTVEWENRLLEIERKRSKEDTDMFCSSIADEIRRIISSGANAEALALSNEPIGPCPWCGQPMTFQRGVARCECGKRIYARTLWMPKDVAGFSRADMAAVLNGKSAKATLLAKSGASYRVSASIDKEKTRESQYVQWSFEFPKTKNFKKKSYGTKRPSSNKTTYSTDTSNVNIAKR